jgi:S-formylglutathione hydrolase FrmB
LFGVLTWVGGILGFYLRWFSPGTSVSSNNKTYITEILLKVALSKIKQANNFFLLVLALSYFKGYLPNISRRS